MRRALVERKNHLTDVRVHVDLDGTGRYDVKTGVSLFDHMLTLFARHGLLNLEIEAKAAGGETPDADHVVEDVGTALGESFAQALGDKKGIWRFANAAAPLDEAVSRAVVDVSGRGQFFLHGVLPRDTKGEFDGYLAEEFLRRFTMAAGVTLHLEIVTGTTPHHVIESAFKAVALGLRMAVTRDPRVEGVPSTKGVL